MVYNLFIKNNKIEACPVIVEGEVLPEEEEEIDSVILYFFISLLFHREYNHLHMIIIFLKLLYLFVVINIMMVCQIKILIMLL